MSWYKNLDPSSQANLRSQEYLKLQQNILSAATNPAVAERMAYINERAPWIAPNNQLALARSFASDQAIDTVADFSSRELVATNGNVPGLQKSDRQYAVTPDARTLRNANVKKDSGVDLFGVSGFYDSFKQLSRAAIATSMLVPELVSNIAADVYGDTAELLTGRPSSKKDMSRGDFLRSYAESLSLYQLATNWDEQGEGFFVATEVAAKQAEAARKYRGTINGSAFTIGRAAAATIIPEDTIWYDGVSGSIDAAIALLTPDATRGVVGAIGKGVRGVRATGLAARTGQTVAQAYENLGSTVPLLTKADVASYRNAMRSEAGITESLDGLSLDVQRWETFTNNNPAMRRVLQEVADEKSAYKIMEKYNWQITPETAEKLAATKSVDDVKYALVGEYAMGTSTLSRNIRDIAPGVAQPVKYLMKRSPLGRSRLLSHLPEGQVVINGDDKDRANAVKTFVLSLRGAGATEDEVAEIANLAIKNFKATSLGEEQRDAYKVYEKALNVVLKRNGVRDEVITAMYQRARANMENLRLYMADRATGFETDNGFMAVQADLLKKHFPPSVYKEFVEKVAQTGTDGFGFARPMQLSELFNRVQTLPDYREVRRLTSNQFMQGIWEYTGVSKPTKALFSGRETMEVKTILDQNRYDEITKELAAMRGKNLTPQQTLRRSQLNDELDDIVKFEEKRVFTGEANIAVELLDTLQNAIWKPLQLATIGYVVRNAIDAQVRMAIGGGGGILRHPGEYISLLIGETKEANRLLNAAKKAGFGTKEKSIFGEGLTAAQGWENLRKDHSELLQLSMRKLGLGNHSAARHMRPTNSWRPVTRGDSIRLHTDGILQQGGLAYADDLQRLAAKGISFGWSEEQIINEIANTIEGSDEIMREISGIFRRGIEYKDRLGREAFAPPIDIRSLGKEEMREWLKEHAYATPFGNVLKNTGNLQEVAFMYGFDRVGRFDKILTRAIDDVEPVNIGEEIAQGSFVRLGPDEQGVVMGLREGEATIVPVMRGGVFNTPARNQETVKQARKLIRNSELYDEATGRGLPVAVAREMIFTGMKSGVGDDRKMFTRLQDGMDALTDKVFGDLYAQKWVKTTERSPVFRKFYYEEVSNQIQRLSPDEAQKLASSLAKKAKAAGFDDIGQYIGDPKTGEKILNIAKSGKGGNATAKELDDYARLVALNKTKGLLYDASQKNNFEDISRIIFPFIGAWREILGRYMSFMIEDPSVAARFGRISYGLTQADPDKDGRGFWYRDPQTNELYFKFPSIMGFGAGLQLSGVDAFFEAPVAQLSQGMSWIPGLGPLAQIPASFLLRNTPDTNKIVQTLLPYGKTELSASGVLSELNPAPGVVRGSFDVLLSLATNREDQVATEFANTYVDVMRAKSASGEYNLADPKDIERLKKDSKSGAQIISVMRVAQRFLGPTAPQVGYKVKKGDVDVYVDEMIKEFQKMQEQNYDTSVQRFLNVYGKEMELYVGSKTRTVVKGLEGSREFGEWELANSDIFTEFPDEAAYFANAGSDFNFDVYQRQLKQGKRVKLTDDELIQTAQNRIGSAKYRAARKLFGAFPNEQQREILDMYRAQLNEEHPGFPRFAEFKVGEYENTIFNLKKMVVDPRLVDNPLSPVLRKYLAARDSGIAQSGGKSLDSKRATPYRSYLYYYGNQLAEQNAEFARIWQRVLAQEVED